MALHGVDLDASSVFHDGASCRSFRSAEMEMIREGRAREKEEGVDRNACIVDRSQFFNTQVTYNKAHSNNSVVSVRVVNNPRTIAPLRPK